MNEREREELALFRYGAISDFISGSLARGEQKRLMALKAARPWRCPSGQPVTVSIWQLKAWLKQYRRGGVDGLRPKRRKDSGQIRALSEPLRKVFSDLRLAHPDWGVPELVRQARQSGLVSDDEGVALSTLYRLIGRAQREASDPTDRRKYAFEQLLACVQADVMYGPRVTAADASRQRSYLHVLLDDCSRLVLHGEFLASEKLSAFERALKTALLRRGYVPERLYTDNGAAFISHHLQWVAAQLGLQLLHTRPGVPEGRGKIERFFRTVQEQFLAAQWREGMTFEQLNTAFWQWVEMDYHRRPHQGLDGKTPLQVWVNLTPQLARRPRVEAEQLTRLFRHRTSRRVAKDRTFSLQSQLYEAPLELIGQRIEVLYDLENLSSVEILHQQRSYGDAHPVHIYTNCQIRRGLRFSQEVRHA